VRALVNEVIDRFIDRGECDFHAEFSMPLPCMVFLSLTGLPLAELPRFLTWKDNIIRPDTMDMDEAASIRKQTGAAIYAYFERAIDERADGRMDDIISRFMRTEVDGRTMSRNEMLDLCYLFILGGLDTVTATLDCSIAHLARHPHDRQVLVEDPSLVPDAVEELLRLQTPVMQVLRVVLQPHEMHGVKMEPGDHVLVMLGSADTDPTEFGEDADLLNLHRESNRHLAFGGGPHRCLGSHLARLELRIAIEELHRRIPDYRLADDVELEYSPGIREIKSLPLVFS
jgi:cytochrome P450